MMMIKFDRELVLYVFFGALTFLVNIVTYFIFEDLMGINYLISNILAWFFSVLFAYVTNRIWVFESKSPDILKEMSLFFGGRIFSGAVDTGLMYLFIDVLMISDLVSKIVVQVIVIILNYIFSKLIVFKD
jgi:putative flippase GtrA